MSTSALERYSTLSKPLLNFEAASIFFTSASGIGSPVLQWRAKRSSTSRVGSQLSSSCDGNST